MSHWTIQPKSASKHHTNNAGVFCQYSDPTPNLPALLLGKPFRESFVQQTSLCPIIIYHTSSHDRSFCSL